ncbi:NAD(P)-binding protein [Pterulicium gracile]|uniref:NAD(P)-binding protein n=1 Tax=Pterulicium gracile TaxID=1884261 RepID=A0A5C3Q919_9AGAR|nr:NAD(P)-binding protein [Pterula gracilis]
MDLGFDDVHVLVTGIPCASGIELVKLFLDLGAQVTGQYNTNAEPLTTLAASHPKPKNLLSVQASLTSEDSIASLYATASEHFKKPVAVLVINHAKVHPPVALVDMDLGRWEDTIKQDLTSPFLVTRKFLGGLRTAQGGPEGDRARDKVSVVFVGSTAGLFGEAFRADYAAAKSAVMYGLPLSLKNEIVKIAPRGRVKCVAPGWTKTPRVAGSLQDPNLVGRALATMPLNKVAEPKDIAYQVAILASSVVSGHVTGQLVVVAGGMEGRLLSNPGNMTI